MAETSHSGADPAAGADPLVRPAVAGDIDRIYGLVEAASATTTVLPRTRDSISEHVRDFLVVELDGAIVGCGALAVFTRNLAEVKSLVVDPAVRGRRLGGRLVEGLVAEAQRLGVRRVFALTDNPGFFQRLGFSPAAKESFPYKVWTECSRCPKLQDCQEVAVEMILKSAPPKQGLV